MDFDDLYPNRFLKSSDIGGEGAPPKTFVIEAVTKEELEGQKGKQWKAIIKLKGEKKDWVANRTNGEAIKLMFGRVVDEWTGKRVTLCVKVIEAFGEEQPAIRVMGSPDITEPMKNEVKRGKKTIVVKVVPTGKPAANGKAAAPPPRSAELNRLAALWKKAETLTTKEGFKEWTDRTLGEAKASEKLTSDDLDQLEAAFPVFADEMKPATAVEPGAEG